MLGYKKVDWGAEGGALRIQQEDTKQYSKKEDVQELQ